MKVGTRLRDFRMKADKTLKEISTETGLSVSFISDIERGITNPSLETLQRLGNVYKTSLSSLLLDVEIEL